MIRFIFSFTMLLISVFSEAQNIGINTTTPSAPLDIRGVGGSSSTLRVFDYFTPPATQRMAIEAFITTTASSSAAISGATFEGGSVSGVEPVTYGVLGIAGTGYGVAGFSTTGTALRGSSSAGLALHCTGLIKLTGLGEASGKVLTSDAAGNASWQTMSNNHFGETWTGSGTYSLNLLNDGSGSLGLRSVVTGTGNTFAVSGEATSNTGIGLVGASNSSGFFHQYHPNTGVVGVAGYGTGVFGGSVGGLSIYGFKGNSINATGSVAKFENQKPGITDAVVVVEAVNNQPALELNNGFIKVSGTNKMAFKHLTTAGNTSGNVSSLNYSNQTPTDILIATHIFNTGTGIGGNYLNKNYGVWWNGSNWTIYLEDTSNMPVNSAFNVIVIKQ